MVHTMMLSLLWIIHDSQVPHGKLALGQHIQNINQLLLKIGENLSLRTAIF